MPVLNRRNLFRNLAAGAAFFETRGLYAESLQPTARLTEGPFYPDKMPLDTDNDLLIVNDSITPAVGEVTYLSGRILTPSGEPLRNAFVEIWQVDNKASYIHTRGRGAAFDSNFQGYGRFLTGADGRYNFRTVKPVPYGIGGMARAPHIHVAVSRNGRRILTTQCLIRGEKLNANDGVFRSLRDQKSRESVLVDFNALPGSALGELAANFDVILDHTPRENEEGKMTGGIGKSEGGRPGGPGGPGGLRRGFGFPTPSRP